MQQLLKSASNLIPGINFQSMDITKLIVTKKGADKIEYQNQYIHIPHSVISSRNYLKNDAIIVEVKVTKTDRDSSMS